MLKQLHHYGPQVRWLNSPLLQGQLAELCSASTHQPRINHLVANLYRQLLLEAMTDCFHTESFSEPTRMSTTHGNARSEGTRIANKNRAVIVNLARAGTLPSHLCYEMLHDFLPAENLRQDHLMAARLSDVRSQVTGTSFGGMKIGGDIERAHLLVPDPMGATGGTLISTLDHYRQNIPGTPASLIALHLIVTPEYLKRVLAAYSHIKIYTLRVDRGLSAPEILASPPGLHWDQETGLNDHGYIVPGGGGFGEIMNNSFV